MDLQVVHLRVNDAATGKPTPVRIRLTDATGRYYAPLGRLPSAEAILKANPFHGGNIVLDGKAYAYIDGACEVLLPAGPIRAEISKGPRYQPIDQTVERLAGKMALRFAITKLGDLQGMVWADLFTRNLSPKAAALAGAAEGLGYVHLTAEQTNRGDMILIDDFSGEGFAECKGDCNVQVGTFNQGGELGSLVLLNAHRVVYPLRLDQPGFEAYTLHDWCHQAHRKKGVVIALVAELDCIEVLPNLLLGDVDGLLDTGQVGDATAISTVCDALNALEFLFLPMSGSGRSSWTTAIGERGAGISVAAVSDGRREEVGEHLFNSRGRIASWRKNGEWWNLAGTRQGAFSAAAVLGEALNRRELRIHKLDMPDQRRTALAKVFAEAREALKIRTEQVIQAL